MSLSSIIFSTSAFVLAFVTVAFPLDNAIAQYGSDAAETRVALVIANGDYGAVGRLPNPERDGELIASTLRALRFETTVVSDLDQRQLGAEIDRFASIAATADIAAVYYAGHAIQIASRNFLLPIDAELETPAAVEREAVSLDAALDALSRAKVGLLFLDACRDNPFRERLAEQARSLHRSASVSRGLAVVRPVADLLVAYATLPNEVASDGAGNHSPFARALARHLTAADTEISVVMKRVTADVISETEGRQRPQQLSQMRSEVYLNRTAPDSDPTTTELRATLLVYPRDVTKGDEISVVADLDRRCLPEFFALSRSGRLIPIPTGYFLQTLVGTDRVRYEISANSNHGLIVEEGDAREDHVLGFACTLEGALSDAARRSLFNQLKSTAVTVPEGRLNVDGTTVHILHEPYRVR